MVRNWIRVPLCAALGAAVLALSAGVSSSADDKDKKDEKTPTIKEIMAKGHKGTDAYLAKIKSSVKAGNWDEAKQAAKGLDYFGESLEKLTPPKGEKASWEKLTKKYHENTTAVLKATEKKDAAAATTALDSIGKSCMECHSAHKGK